MTKQNGRQKSSASRTSSLRLHGASIVHFRDEPQYWLHRDRNRAASAAHIIDAVFEEPGESARPTAVKSMPSPGLTSEIRRYRELTALAIKLDADGEAYPDVPKLYRSRSRNGTDYLVLERALSSLDRIVERRPGEEDGPASDRFGQRLRLDLATLTASSVLRTLAALDSASGSAARGHGDIRLENILLVERAGTIQVVLADWGAEDDTSAAAPEQLLRATPATTTTDLWGLATALWELLHDGDSAYRDDAGRRVRRGDPRLRTREALTLDTVECGCGYRDEPTHVFASQVLEAGSDAAVRETVLAGPDPLEHLASEKGVASLRERLHVDARAVLAQDAARPAAAAAPLRSRLYYVDVDVRERHKRGWLPAPSVDPDLFRMVAERSRYSTFVARLRSLGSPSFLLGRLRDITVGLTVGAVAAAVSVLPLVPVPSTLAERSQLAVAAALLLLLSLVLVVTTVLLRRAVPSRERSSRWSVWPPLTAVAGAAIAWIVIALSAHESWWAQPTDAALTLLPRAAVALACGVLAISTHGLALGIVDYRLDSRRRLRRSTAAQWWSAAAGTAVAAVSVLAVVVAGTPGTGLLAASATTIAQGLPADAPVFYNPDDLAVSSDGTIAVLERQAEQWDVVWMQHPGGSWYQGLRIPLRTADLPAPSGALDGLLATGSELLDLATPDARAALPTGDPLSAISGFDFLSPSVLAVIGPEGVSTVDVSGPRPVVHTLTDTPSSSLYDWDADIVVSGDLIYATDFDGTALSTAETARWDALPMCRSNMSHADPKVVTIDPEGNLGFPTWYLDGMECVRDVSMMVEQDTGIGFGEWVWDSEAKDWTTVFHRTDGGELQLTQPGGFGADSAVLSGGRLVTEGPCLNGYPVDSTVGMPEIAERSWYTEETTERDCAEDPLIGGFLGTSDDLSDPSDTESADDDSSANPASDSEKLPSCRPSGSGQSVLDMHDWKQNPIALGPDGSLYISADAGYKCTSIIWQLGPADTTWTPVLGYYAEPEDGGGAGSSFTTTTASEPRVVNGVVSWMSAIRWQIVDQTGSSRYILTGPSSSYRVFGTDEVATAATRVSLTVPYDSGISEQDALGRTKLVVWPTDRSSFELSIPNATAVGIVAGQSLESPGAGRSDDEDGTVVEAEFAPDTVIAAICGAIVSFEVPAENPTTTDPREKSERWWMPGDDVFTVIAGSAPSPIVTQPFSPAPACEQSTALAAKDSHSDTEMTLFPTTLDAVRVDGDLVVAFGEQGTFDGEEISRIRVIDPSLATDGLDPVRTIGCSDTDPTFDGSCAGDLGSLGLLAVDIALRPDGTIAVATIDGHGPGPVLLFDPDGTREVLRLDPQVLATGVAWDGQRLIVTDGGRGDVISYKFTER